MNAPQIGIVTGASRGLGAVIADVLARRGYQLVLGGRDGASLERMAAMLRTRGVRVTTIPGNVADTGVQQRLIDAARDSGGLRLLVNNASELGGVQPLVHLDPAVVERVLRVNTIAPLSLATIAAPLLESRRGLVVNISSDAAHGAYAGWGAYGASKAALELLSRTMAAEWRDRGIAVITVDPGDMRTQMHQEAFPGEDISDRPLPSVTVPFWEWLLDQDWALLSGERFAAQQEASWAQPVS
jgi:NAD(P)-dependent dehydrogenase (short-subunit alcohol dehydrogenase family)